MSRWLPAQRFQRRGIGARSRGTCVVCVTLGRPCSAGAGAMASLLGPLRVWVGMHKLPAQARSVDWGAAQRCCVFVAVDCVTHQVAGAAVGCCGRLVFWKCDSAAVGVRGNSTSAPYGGMQYGYRHPLENLLLWPCFALAAHADFYRVACRSPASRKAASKHMHACLAAYRCASPMSECCCCVPGPQWHLSGLCAVSGHLLRGCSAHQPGR